MPQPARQYHTQQVHYLQKAFTFSDIAATEIGTLPAGATIIRPMSGVQVNTVFNAGTANVIDIGTLADDDLYATDLAGGTATFVPLDENVNVTMAADTTLYVKYVPTGTAATTGAAVAIICYVI